MGDPDDMIGHLLGAASRAAQAIRALEYERDVYRSVALGLAERPGDKTALDALRTIENERKP